MSLPWLRDVDALEARTFDLLVIGGGINGAGAARDAARRGLSVALVEQEDFGHGTTGRSTRLVHGGLRYLAMYDFGLVHEGLLERERLLRNAGHLVAPITFLIPFYKGQRTPPWKLKAGLVLYDLLAGDTRVPRHRRLSREALLELEPGLRTKGLRGGATYGDGQVSQVERLCVENVLDAAAHGAVIVNHAQVEEVLAEDGRVHGAWVHDRLSGRRMQVRARRVLNTTGPWVDRVHGITAGRVKTRMTKGVHLVTPQETRHAILLFSPDDDRVFFSIPWLGHQLVGTTDTDYAAAPEAVAADAADVDYLQRGIRFVLPDAQVETVHYAYAGLRNLVPAPGKRESDVSRKHEVVDHTPDGFAGLVSLVGGKITPFRAVCEEVVDRISQGLTTRPSDTADAPLPGAPRDAALLEDELRVRVNALRLPDACASTLAHTHGTRAQHVLDLVMHDPALGDVLCPHAPLLRAEVDFAVTHEMARSASDVIVRRSPAGWLACQGHEALPGVLDVLDTMLGRDAAERQADQAEFLETMAKRRAWVDAPGQ